MREKINVPEEKWAMVRAEYCSSDISIRQVCKKHGVPYSQTRDRCNAENWNDSREEFKIKSVDKSIDLMSTEIANNVLRAYRLCNKLMDKLDEVVDHMDSKDPDVLRDIKDVTYSMKNLREIGYFKASLDEQEQMARIEKLRKEAQKEAEEDKTIIVKMEGVLDEYSG